MQSLLPLLLGTQVLWTETLAPALHPLLTFTTEVTDFLRTIYPPVLIFLPYLTFTPVLIFPPYLTFTPILIFLPYLAL